MDNEHKRKCVVLMAGLVIQRCCEAAQAIEEEEEQMAKQPRSCWVKPAQAMEEEELQMPKKPRSRWVKRAQGMEEEEQIVKKPRSCWVKPWRESRKVGGDIQKLLEDYQLFDDKQAYKSFLTMDVNAFCELLSFVKEDIARCDTSMRKCIPAEEKLAAALRFLGTGESFKELAQRTKLSAAFLGGSVMEVCTAINKYLGPKYLKFPDTKTEWLRITKDFEEIWQFPNCLGALGGKHFYDNNDFHSIVLLAVADAFGKFVFVDVCCNGRINDLLSRSILSSILENDENFPEAKIIDNKRQLPYVLVANNAFPLGKHIITPFNRKNLSRDEIIFNERLGRARQNIERAFGMLSKGFQILQRKIPLREDKTKIIVQASCVLHNFLIQKSDWYRQGMEDIEIEPEQHPYENNFKNNREGLNIRTNFKEFFYFEDT